MNGIPIPRIPSHHHELWPVVFDVVLDPGEGLDGLQGGDEGLRLRGGPPVDAGAPGADERVEEDDAGEGGEGRPVVHEDHDPDAQRCSGQGNPLVVVPEKRIA